MNQATKNVPVDDNLINYGALKGNLVGANNDKKFYVTTAIAYTNGFPHMGHAYEALSADVIARYMRVQGYDTFFLTGSDEHGQKVAAAAEKNNMAPIDHCNLYVDAFRSLNQRLCVSNDYYQRTTEKYHEETSQRLWKMCADMHDDIYLDTYEGWYNEREEMFVTDAEAEANQFVDASTGLPLKRVSEESYFFRMSKYCDALINKIETEPTFIQPEMHRNSILSRLKKDGLRDLSISRTTFNWGIPAPEGFQSNHVMYVWFDALTNYLSGVHGLDPAHPLHKYWPANVHIIGKDIVWFHTVIWPCMLMSAGMTLPACVFSHGFVNAADGRKMSKSFNNSVDPNELLDLYPTDSLRYYLTASITYGADLNMSASNMIQMHNSELADVAGNLIHRVLTLCGKYCDNKVPDVQHDEKCGLPFDLAALVSGTAEAMKNFAIHTCIHLAMEAVRQTNRWLTEAEPWKMKGADEPRRVAVVRTALEALYAFTHFLAPVVPQAAHAIFSDRLNTAPVATTELRTDFYNLTPGTPTRLGDILFTKIEDPDAPAPPTAISMDAAREAKKKAKAGKAAEAVVLDMEQPDLSRMDLRVGVITKVWDHPTAERLYCEEIDVGDEAPRQIASGLREHYSLEEMMGRKVLVVCNLKEAKLQGFASNGMVLACKRSVEQADGSSKVVVQLVEPGSAAAVGERACVEGMPEGPVWAPNATKKHKVWEAVAPHLHTNADGVACYKDQPLITLVSKTQCTVVSNFSSPIS